MARILLHLYLLGKYHCNSNVYYNCNMKTFSDRVKARRLELGLSQAALAQRAGLSQTTVAQIEQGRNSRSAHILNLAAALGTDPRWLADGEGPKESTDENSLALLAAAESRPWPLPAIPRERIEALAKEPAKLERLQGAIALAIAQIERDLLVSQHPTPSLGAVRNLNDVEDAFPMAPRKPMPWEPEWEQPPVSRSTETYRPSAEFGIVGNVSTGLPAAANDKFEKVPELADVRLAAGEGIENDIEVQTGFIQFRRSFLRSVGADGGRGRVVYAKGDSMDPDIKDGWALLVVPEETSVRDLVPNTIYAINYDGKMLVKAVVRDKLTGRWVGRSTNARYADVPLENDLPVRVLGRIAWAGGLLPEGQATQWMKK